MLKKWPYGLFQTTRCYRRQLQRLVKHRRHYVFDHANMRLPLCGTWRWWWYNRSQARTQVTIGGLQERPARTVSLAQLTTSPPIQLKASAKLLAWMPSSLQKSTGLLLPTKGDGTCLLVDHHLFLDVEVNTQKYHHHQLQRVCFLRCMHFRCHCAH